MRSELPGCRQWRDFQMAPVPSEIHVLNSIGVPFPEVMQSSSCLLICTNRTTHPCQEQRRPVLVPARQKNFEQMAKLHWTNEQQQCGHCLTSWNREPQRNRCSFEECNTHALRIHVACETMTGYCEPMNDVRGQASPAFLDFTPGTLRIIITTSTSESRNDYDQLRSKKATNHNKREEACPGASLLDCTPGTFRIIITTSTNENKDDGGSMTR